MKRGFLLCLLTLLLCLSACSSGEGGNPNVFEENGYTVDLENQTITHGEDVYTFTVSGGGSSSSIRITYPNGATYFWEWSGNGGHGGWSDDYDPVRYADGDFLRDLLDFQAPAQEEEISPLLIVLLLAVGGFNLAAPRASWYLTYGWRYKDAEPSGVALVLNRVVGALAVLLAVVFLLI